MQKLKDRKQVRNLSLLCMAVYMVSYISRINLGAVMVELVATGYAPMTTAALALTLCSVTYGVGQVVSGWMGDRFRPQHLVLAGFCLTGAVNVSIGLLENGAWLAALWAVNGFAQALMWPPLVVILSSCMEADDYNRAVMRVSWGSSFGTIAVYLLSPVLLQFTGVQSVFVLSGLAALAMGGLRTHSIRRHYEDYLPAGRPAAPVQQAAEKPAMGRPVICLIAWIMLAIVLQGALRDGVSNWMPTYVSDTFRLSSAASILTGVILPLFGLGCYQLTSFVQKRWIRNETLCAGAIFALGLAAAAVLCLTGGRNIAVSLLCLALLTGSMHGVNLLLIGFVPRYFARFGRTALISGVLNSATYIGSALSNYGTAAIAESFGWSSTIVTWTVIALAGTAVCLLLTRRWQAFKEKA